MRYHHSRSSIHVHVVLVAVVERVLDPPRLDERGVDVAGHPTSIQPSPCGPGRAAPAASPAPGSKSRTTAVSTSGRIPAIAAAACGRGGGGRHYFTPPAVSPRTISFWAARNAITTGALTTIAAAISWFQYTLLCDE